MNDKVCVVMSTYNGEKYLKEQLESIFCQKNVEVVAYVRDDGSKDHTIDILEEYKQDNFILEKGENCGAKISFLRALRNAPDSDYYAFADQDDVWDEDKLVIAVQMIKNAEKTDSDKSILYCGRTRLVDEKLDVISKSLSTTINTTVNGFLKGQPLKPAGCTMVFNRNLRNLTASYMPTTFPMHDAWINNLCLAAGGIVIYDPTPHMNYRQHGHNVVGGKRGVIASIKRRLAFHKKMGKCYHSRMLTELYTNYKEKMPFENIERYKYVMMYKKNLRNKIKLLLDKDFLKGDKKYKAETAFLILLNCY